MARKARWEDGTLEKGLKSIKLSSWKYFSDYITQELLDFKTYVYRGHGDNKWKLEPTLDRIIKIPSSVKRQIHLEAFKLETRGRRGPNPSRLESENDWWALGQHHGLATPLLDWSESPFVALYFAASSAYKEKTTSFSIHCISQAAIEQANDLIMKNPSPESAEKPKPTVEIIRPYSDENNRLVNQRGLFTRSPNNVDLESWMQKYNPSDRYWQIMKITIPSTGLVDCLRYLNRMNINHSTLFPDLTGASEYCNKHLMLNKY